MSTLNLHGIIPATVLPTTPDFQPDKEALLMLGVLPNAVVRPPLLPLSAEERELTRRALVRAGQLEAAHT